MEGDLHLLDLWYPIARELFYYDTKVIGPSLRRPRIGVVR